MSAYTSESYEFNYDTSGVEMGDLSDSAMNSQKRAKAAAEVDKEMYDECSCLTFLGF